MAWPIIVLCLCLLVTLGVLYLCATRVDRSNRDSVGIVVMSAFLSFVTMIEMPMFGNIDVESPGREAVLDFYCYHYF